MVKMAENKTDRNVLDTVLPKDFAAIKDSVLQAFLKDKTEPASTLLDREYLVLLFEKAKKRKGWAHINSLC